MTAEQILKEIEALPKTERERLVQCMRKSADIPQDFIDALDDFNQQRFVSMETALNETPPTRELQVPRGREILRGCGQRPRLQFSSLWIRERGENGYSA